MTLFAAPRISCEVVGARDEETARIFNIQRYSLNDGQGIRTVVFLRAVRIPVRGALIRNLSRRALKRCAGKINACVARRVCGMPTNVLPARLSVLGVILRWMNWNAKC